MENEKSISFWDKLKVAQQNNCCCGPASLDEVKKESVNTSDTPETKNTETPKQKT